ncbi:MAG: chemotaxis protein CheW [Schwartzia sp.]|jgi:purine-binding chemotaxis protein CheW|nr:chemotaxis protein CheW [Schwartzia sp. (in: firmicutes)]MBO6267456.1 chemotaxis protein CheW [Synergistaceae bacterium]MBO6209457.1 chemotaxis protein CheW [Schwartzia sp. (in: firmicutes)]MBO6236898.1 chemotaxis protein CheW [Schwartzia sp. (in: firmicutes)]MBO6295662.1 chemotaxis protein CheW [Schwartzia sp. (in: firmicutes)]
MAKELMTVTEGATQVQVVAFKLRREEYGFNILNVKEIKGLTDITRVPFASDFIKGVINLRGSVLPVIDLKKRLGLQDMEYTDDTRIVVVREDDLEVGMIVDAVTGVITLNGEHIDAAKSVDNENSRFITGVGKVEEERLIILLNLEAIIGLQDEIK